MSDIINQNTMQESILYRQRDEGRQYEQYVRAGVARVRSGYREMFDNFMERWAAVVDCSIRTVMEGSPANQVRPKLELIYTSVINQESNVKRQIENIASILFSQQFNFQPQQNRQTRGEETYMTANTNTFKSTEMMCYTNKMGRTNSSQNRSLSFGNGRRKLSKNNYFAEAKKLNVPSNVQVTRQEFYKTSGSGVKKGKKKVENGFKYLEKCLSSTSPSNFVLNYMTKGEQEDKSNRKSHSRVKMEKENREEPKLMINGQIQEKSQQKFKEKSLNEGILTQSRTYQKIVQNIEDKIGNKLDALMTKYTQIEQKMEKDRQTSGKTSIQSTSKQIDEEIMPPFAQRNIKNISQNVSEVKQIDQIEEVSVLERQKVKRQESTLVQTRDNQTETLKKSLGKSAVKSVVSKNKIVRNKIEEGPDGSVETIQLRNSNNHDKIKEEKSQVIQNMKKKEEKIKSREISPLKKQTSIFQKNKEYMQRLITQFHQNTVKFILPISKKLLSTLKSSYLAFCSEHHLDTSPIIANIETEQMKDEAKEMKDNLQKMQKLLNLKCSAEKKEKLLLYFNTFLRAYLSFDRDNNIAIREDISGSEDTDQLIVSAFSKLK